MIKMVVVASIWTLILLATVVVSEVKNTKLPVKETTSTEKLTSNELVQGIPADLSRIQSAANSNTKKEQSTAASNQQQEIVGASSDLFSALTDGPGSHDQFETIPHISVADKRHFLQNMPLAGQLRRIDELNQALEASQSLNRKFNKPTNFLNPSLGRQMAAATGEQSNYNAVNDRFFQDEVGSFTGSPSYSGDLFVNAKLGKSASVSSSTGFPQVRGGRGGGAPIAKASPSEKLDSEDYSENSGELARADAGSDDLFKDDQEEPVSRKASQPQPQKAQARSEEAADDDDDDSEGISGGDDGTEGAASQLQESSDDLQTRRPLKGIEDSTVISDNEQQLEQPSNLKAKKSKPEVEVYLQTNEGKNLDKMAAADLQVAAGQHHKHHHGHYYQYVEVPKKKAWKMGFKRGNHKHTISRHEKGYKNKFHSSFKWNAKEKCKKKGKCHSVGKMTWHYEHHDKKKKHHY